MREKLYEIVLNYGDRDISKAVDEILALLATPVAIAYEDGRKREIDWFDRSIDHLCCGGSCTICAKRRSAGEPVVVDDMDIPMTIDYPVSIITYKGNRYFLELVTPVDRCNVQPDGCGSWNCRWCNPSTGELDNRMRVWIAYSVKYGFDINSLCCDEEVKANWILNKNRGYNWVEFVVVNDPLVLTSKPEYSKHRQ